MINAFPRTAEEGLWVVVVVDDGSIVNHRVELNSYLEARSYNIHLARG